MSTKIKETIETIEIEETETFCLACGNELCNFSILVCAECLDDECNQFLKLAQTVEQPAEK